MAGTNLPAIHFICSTGGWFKGSAGCIDTPFQTGKISDFLDKCQYDVPVYVKYPNECW